MLVAQAPGAYEIDTPALFGRLGVAVAIGLLVGLQRELAKADKAESERFGGSRTFTLFSLAGAMASYTTLAVGNAVVFAAALVTVGALISLGYVSGIRHGHRGSTTEIGAVVVFLAGGLAGVGELDGAAAVGVTTFIVLALKPQVHRFAARIQPDDIFATVKFAVLAVLVLPLLPDETYGSSPFDAATPFKIGLMVVFISGLSFIGYVLIQLVGADRGIAVTGALGGLVSSTAVTVSLSNRSKETHRLTNALGLGLFLAWTIMFIRVLVEIAVVNRSLLATAWLPITAGAVAGLITAAVLHLSGDGGGGDADASGVHQPVRDHARHPVRSAVRGGVGRVQGRPRSVRRSGCLRVGDPVRDRRCRCDHAVDGRAVDRDDGPIADSTASTAIALAAVSNTFVKGGIVVAVGSKALRRKVLPALSRDAGGDVARHTDRLSSAKGPHGRSSRIGFLLSERVPLKDGRSLEIRPSTGADAEAICELYTRLSATDRFRRFFGAFAPRLEWCRTWATAGERGGFGVVVVLHDGDATRIIAEAGYAMRSDGDGDLAVTVERDWRGWIGPYLVDVLARQAASVGVRNLQAEVLLENRPMLSILRHRGAVDLEHPGSEVRLTIGTAGVTPSWPPAEERPKVLIEVAGGRWAGEQAAQKLGWPWRCVRGPSGVTDQGALSSKGGTCPLAEEAAVIVVLLDPDAEQTKELIQAHATNRPGVPILWRGAEQLDVECHQVEPDGAAAVQQILSIIGSPQVGPDA